MSDSMMCYASAFIVLLVLWILFRVISGHLDPRSLVEGADGRISASKLQWFLWTIVIIFAYVAIYTARFIRGNYEALSGFSPNLLTVMGLSLGTMMAAKGITSAYVSSGKMTKTALADNDKAKGNISSIFNDDDGFPDLSKIQMMAWTLIGIGIFLLSVLKQVEKFLTGPGSVLSLPDIDGSLMVLMGFGQAGYLGKKLTTSDTPRLIGLSISGGKPPLDVTLFGMSLGSAQGGNLVTINDVPLVTPTKEWKDTQISFSFPEKQPNGQPWSVGQQVMIGVIINGQESVNKVPFVISQ